MDSANRLPDWLSKHKNHDFMTYDPSATHGILVSVADNPAVTREKLLGAEVPPLLKATHDELAVASLIDFLNSCTAPVCSTREDLTFNNYKPGEIERFDACSYAESGFISTFRRMDYTKEADCPVITNTRGWVTYVDDDLEPIAIKKFDGVPTTLSLTPLTIDGCSYPAGSLLRMSTPHYQLPKVSRGIITPLSKVGSVKFLRLSAFAHDPEERAKLFTGLNYSNKHSSLTLDEITNLARESIPGSSRVGFDSLLVKMAKNYLARLALSGSNHP